MDIDKKKLYDKYVSSGQVKNINSEGQNISLYFKSRSNFINKIIKRFISNNYSKTAQIIDVACGHGAFVHFLHKNGYVNAKGFDISKEQIDMGNKLGIQNLFCLDLGQYFENNNEKADVFLLIDIIEHLRTDETMNLFEILYDGLNDGGKIIIHVPNAEGLFGMRIRYGDMTHETAFTPNSIKQLLKTIGFSEIQCFEDKPIVHGLKSLLRRTIWDIFTLYHRMLLMAETGENRFILSQNMTVTATKNNDYKKDK
jgi:2-polyprenyl-3-methyl-5-hydroxy-6-metoxy-1,4-benzoquinol methylase